MWAGLLAFGAVSLTLFDPVLVAWAFVAGLLIAVLISLVPRLKSRSRSEGVGK